MAWPDKPDSWGEIKCAIGLQHVKFPRHIFFFANRKDDLFVEEKEMWLMEGMWTDGERLGRPLK